MNKIFIQVLAFLLLLPILGRSQALNRTSIPFKENGSFLKNPQVGGLNSPQFWGVDMNNDNLEDLIVFDRKGNVLMPFIYDGADYVYAPEYVDNFPSVHHFILTYDYNCDGIKDLFGYPTGFPVDGIAAYRAYYDSNNEIRFAQVIFPGFYCMPGVLCNVMNYPSFGNNPLNIAVIKPDMPALEDMDGDGDMDIVTFAYGGSWVDYYENQSQEMGYGCDSLIFEYKSDCWGRFMEPGANLNVLLSPSIDSCVNRQYFNAGGRDQRHAGSTLAMIDIDNDNDKELVLGDISFPDLTLLLNGGNKDTAWIISQEMDFPSNSVHASILDFPAAFFYDVDKDGDRDFIAARNEDSDASENYNVAWYYKNNGSEAFPSYDLEHKNFGVRDMIDNGTYSAPAFCDYNSDGLLDIVIGNLGLFQTGGITTGNLMLYANIGTDTAPAFELITTDYLNIGNLNLRRVAPAFGDIDGDGDEDMLLGEEYGTLVFFENTAGAGNTAVFAAPVLNYQNIDVLQASTPQIIDVNRDGLVDLLIGNISGFVEYYKNTGTASAPIFTLQAAPNNPYNAWGDVDVRPIGWTQGYASPQLVDINGQYELFVGNISGTIRHYTDVETNTINSFTFAADSFGQALVGQMSQLAIADINKDGALEFAMGTGRGGLVIFSEGQLGVQIGTKNVVAPQPLAKIFPNPVHNQLTIQLDNNNQNYSVRIYNVLGQQILENLDLNAATHIINTNDWASGVYFVQIQQGNLISTQSVVK